MINIYDTLSRNLYLVTSLEKKEDGTVTMSAKEIQSYNETSSESLLPGELYGNFSLKDGFLQSSNFVTGSAGWQLTPTSGELNFALSVDSLDIPDTTTANSFHVDIDGNTWWGATTIGASIASVTKAGVLTATGAIITGTITATSLTATTGGTIGGTTITSTALTGGIIRTAASGARIELIASTTRMNAINSTGTVLVINNGDSAGVGILQITPVGTAARGIEFIIPSGLGADAKCITIDNPSVSICIDMLDAGSTGMNIAGASANGIILNHSGTANALDVDGAPSAAALVDFTTSGDYPALEMSYTGAATNSYGIRITAGTSTLKEAIFIDSNADSHLTEGITIDRDGNSAGGIMPAMDIQALNAGGGGAVGIKFNTASIDAVIQVAADATAAGAYAGRIPIYVGTTKKYLHYFDA